MDSALTLALIAAGSALLGSAVGQLGPLAQHWLTARQQRRALLRERFEEMALLVAQLQVDLSRVSAGRAAQPAEGSSPGAAPGAMRIAMLATLYFPACAEAMERLRQSALAVEGAMRRQAGEAEVAPLAQAFVAARARAIEVIQAQAKRLVRG